MVATSVSCVALPPYSNDELVVPARRYVYPATRCVAVWMRRLAESGVGALGANARSTGWPLPLRSRLKSSVSLNLLIPGENSAGTGDLGALDLLEELEDRL